MKRDSPPKQLGARRAAFMAGLLALAAGLGSPAWADEAPTMSAKLAESSLAARLDTLALARSRPPEDVLADVRALAVSLAAAPPKQRDRARLIEVDALLLLGRVGEAEAIAKAMVAEPGRRQDDMALSRAELAQLRVALLKSRLADAGVLSRRMLARRAAWKGDPFEIEALRWTANAISRVGERSAAIALLVEAIAIADRSAADDRKPDLLYELCVINYTLRNHVKAAEYCKQARALAEVLNDKIALSRITIMTANIAANLGEHEAQLQELERSLAIARALKLKRAEAVAQVNLADHAMQQKNWKLTAERARAGLALAQEISDPSISGVARINLAEAMSQMGDLAGGIKMAEEGLREAETMGELEYVVDFLPSVAELYARAGRLPEALAAMQRRVAEGDKLFQRSQTNALAEMQAQFDAAQREQEILLLKRENDLKSASVQKRQLQQRLAGLVAALLVLAGLALGAAYRRVRRSNEALARSNAELAFQSDHDPLTGLFNRRSLQLFLQLSEQAARPNDAPRPAMAFVLADIDHFKQINDRYGHAAGDAVLVEFGQRLTRLVRPGDRLFRWGGEEFLLLLQEWPASGLSELCQRILEAVAHEAFVVEGQPPIALTVSLGACPYPLLRAPSLVNDWKRHLRWADLALYRSKSRGRNQGHALAALSDTDEASLQCIDRDFNAAIDQGLVSLDAVQLRRPLKPNSETRNAENRP